MSELSVSKDFLSKENTTFLYKLIISKNELDNLTKIEKENIISKLIETMKQKFKTLVLSKINNNNIFQVKKQFNDMCVKECDIHVSNTHVSDISKNINTSEHNRKFNRDFNTIKKTVTISDRPLGATSKDNQMSINDRLKELEESRKNDNPKNNLNIPEFLKPIKVGMNQGSYDMNQKSYNMSKNETPVDKPLLGYNDSDSNYSTTSSSNKYNENMSVQDRLKQLEIDRKVGNMSNISSVFNQSTDNILQNQFNNIQPPAQYNQPQPPAQYNQPQPPAQYNQPQPPAQYTQPQPPAQYNQPQPPAQYNQPLAQYNQPLAQYNQPHPLINDIQGEINKIKPTKKSLQLEINKSDSIYNYIFSPLDNITSIKLVSYYLPSPPYNIIEDTCLTYIITEPININIMRGYYSIEKLIEKLNINNDLFFSLDDITLKIKITLKNINVEENINFKIIKNYLSVKLGFDTSELIATNLYDLRIPTKLNFYILNLQEEPLGILNFNGTSICNLNFNMPISLNKLEIKFTTEDNIVYNFNKILYNLSFIIEIE